MIDYQKLLTFTIQILQQTGLSEEKSKRVAEVLLEGDLLGHRTHGLQLLTSYVAELEKDLMQKEGTHQVLHDSGVIQAWDGNYLPGPWLVEQAIEESLLRIEKYGVVITTIQRSHHIACLAAFLEKVTKRNLMIILAASDPKNKTVAPFGGLTPTYSPNPLAIGIPTADEPILIDVSMSTTSNALVARSYRNAELLPQPWLLDASGKPTNKPETFFESPPSTLLPLGGMDLGYKGFGLGLMIEALTNGLGGYGRKYNPERWGCSVFLQIMDPQKFTGKEAFLDEIEFFKRENLKSQAINPSNSVRMPGALGLKKKKQQLAEGLTLHPETLKELKKLSKKYAIPFENH